MNCSFSLINPAICVFLGSSLVHYNLNGVNLEIATDEKDLGVLFIMTVHGRITWLRQIGCLVFRNCAGLTDGEALLRLYYSLVRSQLCFVLQSRPPLQSVVNHLFLIESIQGIASRYIVSNSRDHLSKAFGTKLLAGVS